MTIASAAEGWCVHIGTINTCCSAGELLCSLYTCVFTQVLGFHWCFGTRWMPDLRLGFSRHFRVSCSAEVWIQRVPLCHWTTSPLHFHKLHLIFLHSYLRILLLPLVLFCLWIVFFCNVIEPLSEPVLHSANHAINSSLNLWKYLNALYKQYHFL